jgi:putative inorganic carbon (HCO3(-)) transporter
VSASLLSSVGTLIAAGGACAAMMMAPGRARALVMVATLALLPVLVLGDQWDTERIVSLRESRSTTLAGVVAALAAIAVLAAIFDRLPWLLPLAIVAAIPFRVPLQAGGDQANLLIPLYLVLAGAVAWTAFAAFRGAGEAADDADGGGEGGSAVPAVAREGVGRWLFFLIPAMVALYALQALYSRDPSRALQDVCFFLVPFSFVYVLIRETRWTRRLLLLLLAVVVVEALAFTLFGYWEYLSRHLIWNPEVIRANEFHIYFRVNSLFWDPNIFGRFLVMVIVALTALLLWSDDRRRIWSLAGLILVLWLGLVMTHSLSSFLALLAGLAALAALRWSWRWTAAAVAGIVLAAALALALGSDIFDEGTTLNKRTSGRGDLVSGGLELFGQRPLGGFGSASFSTAFLEEIVDGRAPVSESHTEPITVAAEQGAVGLVFYLGLIGAALVVMAHGLGVAAPGLGGRRPPTAPELARMAVMAAFIALLVHSLSYAGFFEDPVTWLLFALALSLPAGVAAEVAEG